MKKRKIYFCLGTMGHGGAERVVASLANYFVRKNEVSIIVTKDEGIAYTLNKDIEYVVLDKNSKHRNVFKRNLQRLLVLRSILKKNSPDLVIAFLPEPAYRLMIAKSFLPIATIISVRNDPNVEYNNWCKRMLVRLLYGRADGLVFQTPDAKAWFSKKIQKKSVVIPNPIDESFLCNPYKGRREDVIVSVGRLVEQKNHKLLIEAFNDFYKSNDNYKLKIFGDGILREELCNSIKSFGLSDVVELMGNVDDVKSEIYKSKMFVLSSNYEGMPNALMEAMALGLPCISTDCPIGGPKYLIENGESGILVNVNDAKMLSMAMKKIAVDDDFAKRLSKNAIRSVAKLRSEKVNLQWGSMVNSVIRDVGKGV